MPNETPERPLPWPVAPGQLEGPPVPDLEAAVAEGRRRHEDEVARAERLVAQARAGSAPEAVPQAEAVAAAPAPGEYRVEFHWRGETAIYVEHDRRVHLSCAWWGGPTGSVGHLYGVWESAGGIREPMTGEERLMVLGRVIDHAARHHGITLEPEGA